MRFLVFIFVFALTACSSQKPVPVDHFYRLPDVDESTNKVNLDYGIIYVRAFETDGLHRERALVYSQNQDGIELKQFHYQFWIDSPAKLLRDKLVQYFRAAEAAPIVVTSAEPYPDIVISGKINRFDQVDNEHASTVIVDLELRADSENQLIHIMDYKVTSQALGNSMQDIINAYDSAVLECFTKFLQDLKSNQ